MNTLVVYHSQFGNTKTLAEAIGKTLAAFGPVRLAAIGDPDSQQFENVDLLVIGGPTQAHGASQAVQGFLAPLKARGIVGVKAATFDTRLRGPEILWGSAAKAMATTLRHAGLELLVPPESFLVVGARRPELVGGEIERATNWAIRLGEKVAAVPAGVS